MRHVGQDLMSGGSTCMHTSQVQSITGSRNPELYSHINTIFQYCHASVVLDNVVVI